MHNYAEFRCSPSFSLSAEGLPELSLRTRVHSRCMKVHSAEAVGWDGTEVPSEQKSSLFRYFSLPCKLVLNFHALLRLLKVTLRTQVLVYLGRGGRRPRSYSVSCRQSLLSTCPQPGALHLLSHCILSAILLGKKYSFYTLGN